MLWLMCFAGHVEAQYNKAWPGNNSIDIATNSKGHTCVLGSNSDYAITLRELDFVGNQNFFTGYSPTLPPGDELRPTKLLRTPADDYIVVGFYYRAPTHAHLSDLSPFAARFDEFGNFLWLQDYQGSLTFSPHMPTDLAQASIVYVENDPGVESYIITAPADPHAANYSYTYTEDVTINAIRIDGGGMPMWNKKYMLPHSARSATSYSMYQDYPQALTFANFDASTGLGVYFIAGVSVRTVFGWGYYNFFMSIDKDGNIAQDYTEIGTPVAWDNDAIFDASTDRVVIASTMPNISGSGNSASLIGVTQIDNNYSIQSVHHYQYPDATENYAMSIEEDATGDYYLIAASIHDIPINIDDMAMLKLDKVSMIPDFYHRFNRLTSTWGAAMVSAVDQASGTENYVLAGTVNGTSTPESRVVSADVFGDVCGIDPLPHIQGNYTWNPVGKNYDVIDLFIFHQHSMEQDPILTRPYDCDPANPDYKKSLDSSSPILSETSVKLFPTVLNPSDNKVTLNFEAAEEGNYTASLYSVTGKVIEEKDGTFSTGEQSVVWNLPLSESAMYLIRVQLADSEKTHVFRVVKQ